MVMSKIATIDVFTYFLIIMQSLNFAEKERLLEKKAMNMTTNYYNLIVYEI